MEGCSAQKQEEQAVKSEKSSMQKDMEKKKKATKQYQLIELAMQCNGFLG
jgi:hypothetical protein